MEGREFTDRDSADSPRAAIVSESLARRYWPGTSALGRRLKIGDDDSKTPWVTVIGVVADVDYSPWEHDLVRAIYFPYRQDPHGSSYIAIRASADLRSIIPAVKAALSSVDPDQPVYDILPYERVISDQILGLAYVAVVMGVLGLMALVMSAIGVSGVMAYSVTQRIQEIGLRMALGARPRDVLRLFLSGGLKLLAIGTMIGLPAAYTLARLISSLLYGVRAADFSLSWWCSAVTFLHAVLRALIPCAPFGTSERNKSAASNSIEEFRKMLRSSGTEVLCPAQSDTGFSARRVCYCDGTIGRRQVHAAQHFGDARRGMVR
jgi:hypothetical protein